MHRAKSCYYLILSYPYYLTLLSCYSTVSTIDLSIPLSYSFSLLLTLYLLSSLYRTTRTSRILVTSRLSCLIVSLRVVQLLLRVRKGLVVLYVILVVLRREM